VSSSSATFQRGAAEHEADSVPGLRRKLDADDLYTLTFDCYGTLIDWLQGVRTWARACRALRAADLVRLVRDRDAADRELTLEPYRPYREVLAESISRAAGLQGIELPGEAAAGFAASMPAWPPFEESRPALALLAERFQLAILSNVEAAVLERSMALLGAPFELALTAEELRSYKPAEAHFREARARLNLPRKRILHVACSTYHDVRPASRLGWRTAWINRENEPLPEDLEPDLVVPDLSSLAQVLIT